MSEPDKDPENWLGVPYSYNNLLSPSVSCYVYWNFTYHSDLHCIP
jgi:hypothetical protein